MTQSTITNDSSRGRLAGVLIALVAVGLPVAAILTADERGMEVQPGLIDWILVGGIAMVTAATLMLLVPWAQRRPHVSKIALTVSVSALLTLVAFWTMLPFILGSAGVWLGTVGRRASYGSGRSGTASAAVAIGAIAALAALAAYVATS